MDLHVLHLTHIPDVRISVRPENILCDSEKQRLRLTNFGNAVDLDPPRVGLDNDNLKVEAPVSIANSLAADVYMVVLIILQLLFNVPDIKLNQELKGVGYDLDRWLQNKLTDALTDDTSEAKLNDALTYLQERKGLWSLLKGSIRPNPLRKVRT